MKFKKDDLKDEIGHTIYDKLIDRGRWTVNYERVFEYEGKCYRTRYSVGATEGQDISPYDYEADEIECPEVFPKQITTTVYLSEEEL